MIDSLVRVGEFEMGSSSGINRWERRSINHHRPMFSFVSASRVHGRDFDFALSIVLESIAPAGAQYGAEDAHRMRSERAMSLTDADRFAMWSDSEWRKKQLHAALAYVTQTAALAFMKGVVPSAFAETLVVARLMTFVYAQLCDYRGIYFLALFTFRECAADALNVAVKSSATKIFFSFF